MFDQKLSRIYPSFIYTAVQLMSLWGWSQAQLKNHHIHYILAGSLQIKPRWKPGNLVKNLNALVLNSDWLDYCLPVTTFSVLFTVLIGWFSDWLWSVIILNGCPGRKRTNLSDSDIFIVITHEGNDTAEAKHTKTQIHSVATKIINQNEYYIVIF